MLVLFANIRERWPEKEHWGLQGQCCSERHTSKMLFDKCTFDNSPATKSRQITPNHAKSRHYMNVPLYANNGTHSVRQSRQITLNHAQSRPITPNHGIRQIIDSEKPNVAKLCLHTECCSERLHLNVSKYDQHGVCGIDFKSFPSTCSGAKAAHVLVSTLTWTPSNPSVQRLPLIFLKTLLTTPTRIRTPCRSRGACYKSGTASHKLNQGFNAETPWFKPWNLLWIQPSEN